jgi:uncharacterized protein YneF (UPF0154 family)
MKRFYIIIILFLLIFFIGIFFTVKSIDNSFASEDSIEIITIPSKVLQLSTKL